MHRRYSDDQIHIFIQQALRDGFCVLRDHLPKEKIRRWKEACMPLLRRQIELEGEQTSRGPNRYYVTFPFQAPFADPEIYEDPDLLKILEGLVGKDFVFCQLASDTPLRGSDFQPIHRDCSALFPEWGQETPPFQLAVNFPLVDVTPANGPLDIVRGTHQMSREQGMKLLESGQAAIEPVMLNAGDVMVRDVRTLHRGTPNRTDEPRPMVVLGYSRSWMNRPEVSIRIPANEFARLSETAKRMMRNNPVVANLDVAVKPESYTNFLY